jgi:malate synthase
VQYEFTPEAVGFVGDGAPNTALIHPSAFAQGPDLAMVAENLLGDVATAKGLAGPDEAAANAGSLKLVVPVKPAEVSVDPNTHTARVTLWEGDATSEAAASARQHALARAEALASLVLPSAVSAKPVEGVEGVSVLDDAATEFADVLTPDVLTAVRDIERATRADRKAALVLQEDKLRRAAKGERVVKFRDPSERIDDTHGEAWTAQEIREKEWLGAIPKELVEASARAESVQALYDFIDANLTAHPDWIRWKKALVQLVQLTGPVDRARMLAHALHSGANGHLQDFEDAAKLNRVLESLRTLTSALHEDPAFVEEEKKAGYEHDISKYPLSIPRPSALHLDDLNLLVDGQPVSASVFATVAFITKNWEVLRGKFQQDPHLYVPKINSVEEAKVWEKMLSLPEGRLGLEVGTIKVQLMVERVWEMAELEEVMWVLRRRLVVINAGRYDYSKSWQEATMGQPGVAPDWTSMTMDKAFLRNYIIRIGRLAAKHGVLFIGGMAQQIPEKDEAANTAAMARVDADKTKNEIPFGASGAWIAHPGMNATLQATFKRELNGRPNQLNRKAVEGDLGAVDYSDASLQGLLQRHEGTVTEAGVRFALNTQMQYDVSYWGGRKAGNAAAGIYSKAQGLRLMEDRATTETHYDKLWEWLHKGAVLSDGRKLTVELVLQWAEEEMKKAEAGENNAVKATDPAHYPMAREVLKRAVLSGVMVPWFADLLHLTDGVDDPDAAGRLTDLYVTTYAKTGVRLTPLALSAQPVVEQRVVKDASTQTRVSITFTGPQAEAIAKAVVQQDAQARVVALVNAVNEASQGDAQLNPAWFTATTTQPEQPPAIAIGPSEWLATQPEKTVKGAVDAPTTEQGKVVSAGAVLAGTVEQAAAAAAGREPDPAILAKLKVVFNDAGFLTSQSIDIAEASKSRVTNYQHTLAAKEISG